MGAIRAAMLLECRRHTGEDIALAAPGRPALTHAALDDHVSGTVGRLHALGFGVGDVVAILMANGPEMATAFLAVSACAVAAPLNPAYREEELTFYLKDLGAKCLLLGPGAGTAARAAAAAAGIPVIDALVDDAQPAGVFKLAACERMGSAPAAARLNGPDDLALVLHTSGTTGKPKRVGLRQRNLHASMGNIAEILRLGPSDRCLNVMPLFHIHGLIAALGASLASGGSVVCTPGFNALRFVAWMREFSPTWYTAVPTMHQAILERLGRQDEGALRDRLRFVRSSSAALPASVFAALETAFGCPVVEAYGMTEAAHQISSNGLAPGARRPGSVGFAAGPEIAIMDETGNLLPPGVKGEIVIRGSNVHAGYLDNADANRAAFAHGWFRTGDQGILESDGRLVITGRFKELINRGGEKISPLELEDILLRHPNVKQAVAFGVPHRMLGEEVVAAIVATDETTLSAEEIRDHVRAGLAEFKVPRRVIFVSEIPKGATGKVQRATMAERLGLHMG